MLRDAIFGLEQRPSDRGLRQEITELCAQLSPTPEISFSGPVDTVAAGTRGQLIAMLAEALGPVQENAVEARIGIAVSDESFLTVIEAAPLNGPKDKAEGLRATDFAVLRDRGTEAGIPVDVKAIPGGVRVVWQVPRELPLPAAGT